jgi:hypothetical protein
VTNRLIVVIEWEPDPENPDDNDAAMLAHITRHARPAKVTPLSNWRAARSRVVNPPSPRRRRADRG